ncbi:MAG: pilus assembly protein [Chloroflexi bacterium]|nr:pilus assembly protein [Chloroflexota bacterium]
MEFALVLIPFMLLLLGIFDMGRGIYTYNAVSQAAREIARVSSIDMTRGYTPVGTSPDSADVKSTQKALTPGLTDAGIDIDCVDVEDDEPDEDIGCRPGDFVRVRIEVQFAPITPLLGQLGPFELASVSHVEIQ